MDKVFFAFTLMLLLSTLSSAQSFDTLAEDFSIPFELSLSSPSDHPEIDLYVVYGSGTDSFERMVSDSITSNPTALKSQATAVVDGKTEVIDVKINKHFLAESETTLDALKKGPGVIILVGGATHNNITRMVYEAGYITNESERFQDQLVVGNGLLDNDSKVLVLAHRVPPEGARLEREAVKYSPLALFIPEEYVPIAATGIGMFLMNFINVFKSIGEIITTHLGRGRIAYDRSGIRFMGVRVKEILEFFAGSLVLGAALTYTFAGPTERFWSLLPLFVSICTAASLFHELAHRVLSKLLNIRIQYRFWFTGSLIAILTALLGNCFGIEGFLVEEEGQDKKNWRYGVMRLAGPMMSISLAGFFAYLFMKTPTAAYQIIYTSASISALSSLVSVKGTDGEHIRNWSNWLWFIAFTAVSIIFFTINFVQ